MNQKKQQLQHNELADWLEVKLKELQPHSNSILIGILVVSVVVIGIVYVVGQQSQKKSAAWIQHFNAVDAALLEGRTGALDESADDSANSLPGLWSRLLAADTHLKAGLEEMFQEHDKGRESIETAIADYDTVITQADNDSLPSLHARLGRAIAHEALGDVTLAMEGYTSLIESAGDQPIGKLAEKYRDRLASIPNPEEFQETFVASTPALIPPGSEGFNLPTGTGDPVPNLPDITFPGLDGPVPDQGGGSLPLAPPVDTDPTEDDSQETGNSEAEGNGEAEGDGEGKAEGEGEGDSQAETTDATSTSDDSSETVEDQTQNESDDSTGTDTDGSSQNP